MRIPETQRSEQLERYYLNQLIDLSRSAEGIAQRPAESSEPNLHDITVQ